MSKSRAFYFRYRRHAKRNSPRPPPTEGWLIADVVRLTGIQARTIRDYARRGLIAKAVFRGRGTRYDRECLLRLLAIKRWRGEKIGLEAIGERLRGLGGGELEVCVTAGGALAREVVSAIELGPTAGLTGLSVMAGIAVAGEKGNGMQGFVGRWEHFDLGEGVVLSVRADASAANGRTSLEGGPGQMNETA